jgi:UPF0716 protein FxsA
VDLTRRTSSVQSGRVLLRLALLFVLVPLAELALLVWIGRHVGLAPTVALVVVTGILGAALARRQGTATWRRFREALEAGRPPHRELVDGILVLLAGAVLLTPGLITDVAGFALLVPALRRRAAAWLTSVVTARFLVRTAGVDGRGGASRGRAGRRGGAVADGIDEGVVDVDYRVVEEEATGAGGAGTGGEAGAHGSAAGGGEGAASAKAGGGRGGGAPSGDAGPEDGRGDRG